MKYIKLITLSLLALMIAACGTATATPEATPIPTVIADTTIISEGRLEPVHYTELALNANGLISEVLKVEGDTVAAGDVIARLKSNEAQTLEAAQAKAAQELTTAYQEVRDAQFKLDNFDVPTDFAGMTPPESVAAMLVNLDKARADFEPYKDINDRNLQLTDAQKRGQEVVTGTAKIFKKALDDAWTRYRKAIQWMELESAAQNANSRLVLAQRDYDALQDPTFAEDTAGTRAALANAEVRAPFPGVITDLNLKVGEFEASGLPVVVSDVGGPREQIVPGVTGLVCGGDDAGWIAAVAGLLISGERRRAMGEAARDWACSRTWDAMLAPLFDTYRNVARVAPAAAVAGTSGVSGTRQVA